MSLFHPDVTFQKAPCVFSNGLPTIILEGQSCLFQVCMNNIYIERERERAITADFLFFAYAFSGWKDVAIHAIPTPNRNKFVEFLKMSQMALRHVGFAQPTGMDMALHSSWLPWLFTSAVKCPLLKGIRCIPIPHKNHGCFMKRSK